MKFFYSNEYLFQNDMYYGVDFENLNLTNYALRQIKIRKISVSLIFIKCIYII